MPPPQGVQLLAFHVIVTLSSPSPVSEDSTAVPAFPAGFQAHREVATACAQCVDTLPNPQKQAWSWEDSRQTDRGLKQHKKSPIKQCRWPSRVVAACP